MKLKPLFEFDSDISDRQELGDTPFGKRIIYVVGGGRFWGERVNGQALPGGGDWVITNENGLAKLDVRKTLKTDDGALIYITYTGLYQFKKELSEKIEAGQGYEFGETLFKVQMQFETGDERYAWLNTTLAVAEGKETGTKVQYRAFEIVS
ncbi:DUF3237 domain-containing protein [Reichenbachiella sp.]